MGVKFSQFTLQTTINPTDYPAGVQSGVSSRWYWDTLHKTAHTYRVIQTTKYTALAATESTISMSDTSDFATGLPVRFKVGSTAYYALCTAVTSNTSITIAGATLSPSGLATLSELAVGSPGNVQMLPLFVSSTYGNGSGDLLAADMNTYFKWLGRKSYLVTFSAVHKVADTGASQPKVNVKIAGSAVSTADSNNGVQLSTAGTWVDNGAVSISTSLYDINYGESVEVACTAAGSNGDATNLTVLAVFVSE